MHDRRRLIAGLFLPLLGIAALLDLARLGPAAPWRTMYDFPDFYCAGWALDRHADPYLYEPLHTCERQANTGAAFRGEFFRANPSIAVPAPLPAYDFPPYMALARLPVRAAAWIAGTAIVAAVALCAVALAALGLPLDVVAAALLLSAAYMSLNTGQIVPIALLALVLCGLALSRRADVAAGVFAALTAIEPLVGLPVIVATLSLVPRARWPLVVTGAILGIAAFGLVGAPVLVQYVTAVLPAQAAAEIHFPYQYSLAYAFAYLGLSSRIALLAGTASYFVLLVAGLLFASRAESRLNRRELIVFIPALCATLGGTYLHPEELCFALPAVLVLATVTRGARRAVLAVACCALAIPWILVWGEKQLFLASLFVCAVILLRLRVGLPLAVTSFCLIAAMIYALELQPPHLPAPRLSRELYSAGELVQNEWRQYAESRSTRDAIWIAVKLPAWLALLGTLAVLASTYADPKRMAHEHRRYP